MGRGCKFGLLRLIVAGSLQVAPCMLAHALTQRFVPARMLSCVRVVDVFFGVGAGRPAGVLEIYTGSDGCGGGVYFGGGAAKKVSPSV